MTKPQSIADVVTHGLCIGCGLCEGMAPDRYQMVMHEGRLRPRELETGDDSAILQACPGATVAASDAAAPHEDQVWGMYHTMSEAWAGDPDVRFRAATGGVLTALGQYLLSSGKAAFILHVGADPEAPMRSRWVISEAPADVLANAGSRYGPAAPLAGVGAALERGQPFAVICKPCDANALTARRKADPLLDQLLVAVLVMVCGGASELGKSQAVLADLDVAEADLTLFRYRDHGNPGPTRVETAHTAHEISYLDMWADEAGWKIQTRCKLCPDAIGEAADIAASDIWPGGAPTGEDEGFNGLITRSAAGASLVEEAVRDGALVLGAPHTPRDYDDFQPHQVAKKKAMAARLRGMAAAGAPVYAHEGLRIDDLDTHETAEEEGSAMRARSGRFSETLP